MGTDEGPSVITQLEFNAILRDIATLALLLLLFLNYISSSFIFHHNELPLLHEREMEFPCLCSLERLLV